VNFSLISSKNSLYLSSLLAHPMGDHEIYGENDLFREKQTRAYDPVSEA